MTAFTDATLAGQADVEAEIELLRDLLIEWRNAQVYYKPIPPDWFEDFAKRVDEAIARSA